MTCCIDFLKTKIFKSNVYLRSEVRKFLVLGCWPKIGLLRDHSRDQCVLPTRISDPLELFVDLNFPHWHMKGQNAWRKTLLATKVLRTMKFLTNFGRNYFFAFCSWNFYFYFILLYSFFCWNPKIVPIFKHFQLIFLLKPEDLNQRSIKKFSNQQIRNKIWKMRLNSDLKF